MIDLEAIEQRLDRAFNGNPFDLTDWTTFNEQAPKDISDLLDEVNRLKQINQDLMSRGDTCDAA